MPHGFLCYFLQLTKELHKQILHILKKICYHTTFLDLKLSSTSVALTSQAHTTIILLVLIAGSENCNDVTPSDKVIIQSSVKIEQLFQTLKWSGTEIQIDYYFCHLSRKLKDTVHKTLEFIVL